MYIFAPAYKLKTMTPKERIIREASRMFVTQGIKSVRMDDIAHSLGISKRTLYEHFGDKEELLYLALDHHLEEQRHNHERVAASAGNVIEALFSVLSRIMDSSTQLARLLDNLRRFYPAVHERLRCEGQEKNRRALRDMLAQGIAQGLFIDRFNIGLAITVLYHTATAVATNHEIDLPEGITEREAFIQIISSFFRGISTAEGMALIDDCLRRYELDKTQPRP